LQLEGSIGIFDSGVGGLTVYRALSAVLKNENIIYLGDTARVPYGTKSAVTVIRYSRQIVHFLLRKGVKYLVVACNTASANALDVLKAEISVPIMGVVEPGAKAAAHTTSSGKIGIIGTLATIESGAYHRAIHALNSSLAVFGQACPLLVPLAEEGWLDHPITAQVAFHYLAELRLVSGDLDTLVLACTHYPLLKRVLSEQAEAVFGHPLRLIDSAVAVAETVAEDLIQKNLLCPGGAGPSPDQFFFTDVNRFGEIAKHFLGRPVPTPQIADI
jgi:glutamate racemase